MRSRQNQPFWFKTYFSFFSRVSFSWIVLCRIVCKCMGDWCVVVSHVLSLWHSFTLPWTHVFNVTVGGVWVCASVFTRSIHKWSTVDGSPPFNAVYRTTELIIFWQVIETEPNVYDWVCIIYFTSIVCFIRYDSVESTANWLQFIIFWFIFVHSSEIGRKKYGGWCLQPNIRTWTKRTPRQHTLQREQHTIHIKHWIG